MLFPAPNEGWDIIISNPPYKKPSSAEKTRGKQLGYDGYSADTYLMFLEASLEFVRADMGWITFIVPNSIISKHEAAYKNIRHKIEDSSSRIHIRTYDNRPNPVFGPMPPKDNKSKPKENRQRVTVLNIEINMSSMKKAITEIKARGLIRLTAKDRPITIKRFSEGSVQHRSEKQWFQSPSDAFTDLLKAMHSDVPNKYITGNLSKVVFRGSGMYFISILPDGVIDYDDPKNIMLPDDKFFLPWIGLYNSHLFISYWLMVGNGFTINKGQLLSVKQPPGWCDEKLRKKIEQKTKELISPYVINKCKFDNVGEKGAAEPNVNFHNDDTPGPKIINQLDDLMLDAYGLSGSVKKSLMEEMTLIRKPGVQKLEEKKIL